MTVLVAWIPFEQVGKEYLPSSAYIATDSRITQDTFIPIDNAQKVFYSRNSPDIFGFCGDVIAGVTIIQHIISFLERGWTNRVNNEDRFKEIFKVISGLSIIDRNVTILHITRFGLHHYGLCKYVCINRKWDIELFPIEGKNTIKPYLLVEGSGRDEFNARFCELQSNSSGTSRNVFQVLSFMIQSTSNKSCGGKIQLAGLFSKGSGQPIGYVYNNAVWLFGHSIPHGTDITGLELRNDRFERCDPATLQLMEGAQAQPNEVIDNSNSS